MPKIITTSWDDGHPKDFIISELLRKYHLKGTFYIPRTNPENEVMSAEQILQLSATNEIGGHTLSHIKLTGLDAATVNAEVAGCYQWLQEILHQKPVSFCFPLGYYDQFVIDCVHKAGFKIARTTALLSTAPPGNTNLMATTLQAYEHSATTYLKHTLKRWNISNMFLWMRSASHSDILQLTDYYITHIIKNDGCFHLWGHSWEIDKYQLWNKLELIFRQISDLPEFEYVSNGDLAHPAA